MEPVEWQDSYSTGIEEVDNQHKQLVDYLNQLGQAITLKNDSEVKTVVQGLGDYTMSHFAFEEALMVEANYTYAGPHKHIHESLIKKVVGFGEKLEEGEDIVDEFYSFLRRWLVNHIQRDDAAYVATVSAHFKSKNDKVEKITKEEKNGWMSRMKKKVFG